MHKSSGMNEGRGGMTEKAKRAHRELNQWQFIEAEVSYRKGRIRELRSLAEGLRSPSSGDRVQNSGSGDKLGEAIIKVIDAQERLAEVWDDYERLTLLIDSRLLQLKPIHREVLRRRYLMREPSPVTAEELHYSDVHIRRLRAEALEAYAELMGAEDVTE